MVTAPPERPPWLPENSPVYPDEPHPWSEPDPGTGEEFDRYCEEREAERGWPMSTIGQWMEKVDNAGPTQWLIEGIWPADAYGILGAEPKAGKTWLMIDMALSVASGQPWLGRFEIERSGPVMVFLGEGGVRKMTRRIRAVARQKGITDEELARLPLYLSETVPYLKDRENDMTDVGVRIGKIKPALVIVDPLYLAAKGADTSSLVAMGEMLHNVQEVCQAHGCALVVVHHWNKTGMSKGSKRFSGAGTAEWGRVLMSMAADPLSRAARRVDHSTRVRVELEINGDEIHDQTIRFDREVWADDPKNIDSKLRYTISDLSTDGDDPAEPEKPKFNELEQAIIDLLQDADDWLNTNEIFEGVNLRTGVTPGKWGKRRVSAALNELMDEHIETDPSYKKGSNKPQPFRLKRIEA